MERGKRIESRQRPLTLGYIKGVKEAGRYSDGPGGNGLSLLVKTGWQGRVTKSWAQRLRINGEPFNIGLGEFPLVTLTEARDKAFENRRAVAAGSDPRIPPVVIPTFDQALDEVVKMHAPSWKNAKTEKRWRATLDTYASPILGDMLVNEIDSSHIKEVLLQKVKKGDGEGNLWLDMVETSKKVRERIGLVMKWSHRRTFPPGQSCRS